MVFHLSTPGLTGFALEVYAAWPKFRMDPLDFSHAPPPQSDWKALDVLHDEIFNNMHGAPKMAKVVEPALCFAMADLSTIGTKACEVGASDGPDSSPHTSCSPGQLSWTRSQSPQGHSQSSRSSSSSSGSGSRSVSTSGLSSSGSSGSGSHSGSHAGSQLPSEGSGSRGSGHSHSPSPEVVLLQGDDGDTTMGGEEDAGHSEDEEALSQGTVSLLDISTSDNEDAHKATVHEAVCKSDIQYGNWQDEQICQGNEGITQHDKGVNDCQWWETLQGFRQNRSPCILHGRVQGVQTLGYHSEPIGSLQVLSH